MTTTTHWEAVYRARPSEQLGWYEPIASTLGLVRAYAAPSDAVIDVGGGDSRLADALVAAGFAGLTVLDLSSTALQRAAERLGPAAAGVAFVQADITRWAPSRRYDLWHDRAVFHFLVGEAERQAYTSVASAALRPGGRLVIATFAPDGPEQCAGLPVERYDAETLAACFAPQFRLVEARELRGDPEGVGDRRPYVAVVLERS